MERGTTVLISGMGIAGPALAYWLLAHGFAPEIVERAPRLRREGYVIDFWGAGYDIAEKMGVLPEIMRTGYRMRELRIVNDRGRRVGGFDAEVFRAATLGRYTSLPRGELSAILAHAIEGRVVTTFSDSIVGLEQTPDDVLVRFENGAPRRFDLVIGADGQHSAVRALTFGPEQQYEKFLGYVVAAFAAQGYEPRDEDVYVSYGPPGRQVARFSMKDDRTMFLIVVADDDVNTFDLRDQAAQRAYLRAHIADAAWECPRILEAMEKCDDIYFDRVSQIRMDRWSSGRVALVGDAACAPSLLAGQGAALSMIGAYVLAGELARAATPADAFARYEERLGPFMRKKQIAAEGFASTFAPKTRIGVFIRNQLTRMFALPYVAKLAFGSSLLDKIALPEYAQALTRPDAPSDRRTLEIGT